MENALLIIAAILLFAIVIFIIRNDIPRIREHFVRIRNTPPIQLIPMIISKLVLTVMEVMLYVLLVPRVHIALVILVSVLLFIEEELFSRFLMKRK
jgi:hypothetical protein